MKHTCQIDPIQETISYTCGCPGGKEWNINKLKFENGIGDNIIFYSFFEGGDAKDKAVTTDASMSQSHLKWRKEYSIPSKGLGAKLQISSSGTL